MLNENPDKNDVPDDIDLNLINDLTVDLNQPFTAE